MPSLIPKSSYEARPRVAVEIRPEGVFAARTNDASGVLAQVARVELPLDAVQPSLRVGNIAQPNRVAAAVRQVLTQLQQGKLRDVTLIVPDGAVRILLLDFDTLPSDAEEALAVIRFRLTRLLPFSADAAQVSYQVMTERGRQLQVLAVAVPGDVLAEYEAVVRDAGFEPGAVLPSTLAVAAAVDDTAQTATLLVNSSPFSLTTAILRRGELLLHRTLDTAPIVPQDAQMIPDSAVAVVPTLPADVFAMPEPPLREFGEDDLLGREVTEGPLVEAFLPARELAEAEEQHLAVEIERAIAVAAAYYEDSLAVPPETVLTAGSYAARDVGDLLIGSGLRARELLLPEDALPTATSPVPAGLLAGLRGALRSGARPGARA